MGEEIVAGIAKPGSFDPGILPLTFLSYFHIDNLCATWYEPSTSTRQKTTY